MNDGAGSEDQACEGEAGEVGRQRHSCSSHRGKRASRYDQTATLEHISQRHQQNHAENKTDQCESWNVTRRVSDAEGLSHLPKQGLAVIKVGDTYSRRQCHRQDRDSTNLVKVWAIRVRLI